MKRCESCRRAVDDSPGVSSHASCPWCAGTLAEDPRGPASLADAVQVLWSVDPTLPYDGHAAERDLKDLCPRLPQAARDLRVAGEVGALALLRDGKPAAARRALRESAHWDAAAADDLVAAYATLGPGQGSRLDQQTIVSFDGNGADGPWPTSVELAGGASFELPEGLDLTRTGFSFSGWGTSPEDPTPLAPGSQFEADGDTTLYAQWQSLDATSDTVTISFDGNGADGGSVGPTACGRGDEIELPRHVPLTRKGFVLAGWGTIPNDPSPLPPGGQYAASADATLYAQWRRTARKGWIAGAVAVLVVALAAAWLTWVFLLAPITVAFDGNGANSGSVTPIEGARGSTFKLPGAGSLERNGFEFTGWGVSQHDSSPLKPGSSFEADGDVTLYAQWRQPTVTVTFDGNGADLCTLAPVECTKGDEIELPDSGERLKRDGYAFKGWGEDWIVLLPLKAGTTWEANEDTTLYAQWSKVKAWDEVDVVTEQKKDSAGDTHSYVYLTLENEDARTLDMKVTATFTDKLGSVVATDSDSYTSVMPGERALFYLTATSELIDGYSYEVEVSQASHDTSAASVVGVEEVSFPELGLTEDDLGTEVGARLRLTNNGTVTAHVVRCAYFGARPTSAGNELKYGSKAIDEGMRDIPPGKSIVVVVPGDWLGVRAEAFLDGYAIE